MAGNLSEHSTKVVVARPTIVSSLTYSLSQVLIAVGEHAPELKPLQDSWHGEASKLCLGCQKESDGICEDGSAWRGSHAPN